jgi:hypothetical protein
LIAMPTARVQRSAWPSAQTLLAGLAKLVVELRTPRGAADDLEEARELLAYWEQRARRLPRWALRRRREAREMAWRWRERVRAAEQVRYGSGVLGVASQLAAERRMPATLAHRGRQAARLTLYGAMTIAVTLMLVVVATLVALGAAVIGAL